MPILAQPGANLPVTVEPKEEELKKVKEDLKMLIKKFNQVRLSGNYMDYIHMSTYPKARLPEKSRCPISRSSKAVDPNRSSP